MQIKKIESSNQTGFGAINASAVEEILHKKRLVGFVTGRPEEYKELFEGQIGNPYDIVLIKGKFKSLKANIVARNGDIVWKAAEGFFKGIKNADPNKFISNMCKMADYFKEKPEKAVYWASKFNQIK